MAYWRSPERRRAAMLLTPIVHDHLRGDESSQPLKMIDGWFGHEMSQWRLKTVFYTAPDRQELSMAFNFHHLKVDYEVDRSGRLRLLTWRASNASSILGQGNEWSWWLVGSLWTNWRSAASSQPLCRCGKFPQMKGQPCWQPVFICREGRLYIYMGEEIGMVDPDYDWKTIKLTRVCLLKGTVKAAFRIIKAKSRDNSHAYAVGSLAQCRFYNWHPWLKAATLSYHQCGKWNQGTTFWPFIRNWLPWCKELLIIAEAAGPASLWGQSWSMPLSWEWQGQKLVLNNFIRIRLVIS